MLTRSRSLAVALLAAPLAFAAQPAQAQDIVLTGGGADITWFYNSAADQWDVVLREKGSTVASGLDTAYAGFPGIVGAGADFVFDTLTVVSDKSPHPTDVLNGISYFTVGPAGESPDLGFRTRLREGDPAEDQFAAFRLSLDWENSIKPAGAEFALWNRDAFGNPNVVRYETAADDTTSDWPAWGHTHWVWGFSEMGDYTLKFDFEGVGGTFGDNASGGSVLVNFSIIPEPASAMVLLGAGALLATRRRVG